MHDDQTVPDGPSFALQNILKFEKFSFKLARRRINAARIADVINLRPHLPTAVSSSRARAGPHDACMTIMTIFRTSTTQVFIPCSCCRWLAPSSPCTIPVCSGLLQAQFCLSSLYRSTTKLGIGEGPETARTRVGTTRVRREQHRQQAELVVFGVRVLLA